MKVFANATFIPCDDSDKVFEVMAEDNGRIVFIGDSIPQNTKLAPYMSE